MLGNFNLKALENAEQRILDIIATARAKTEELVKIDNKTYMNFVRPLMDLDIEIKKVYAPVNHLDMVNNSDETKKIIEATLPTMSDYSSDMSRHKGIYEGILEIKKKEYNSLTIAQKRVLDESIKGFEIAGIALPKDQQKRLKEISAEIAKLSNDFSNNVIESNKKNKIKVTDEAILGEMPQSDRDSAKIEDGWEFSMLAPSFGPFMDYVTDRNLREQMYKNYTTRAPENEQIIPQILALRDEEAKILGFKNYAELALQFRDAKVPERAHQYLLNLVNIAKPFAEKDMADLKEYAGFDLQPWDYSFYSRKLQKEKYDLDESEIKPYFEGDATMRGMLEIASEMFGIEFRERTVPLWHETARYFDVFRDDKLIAGFYTDMQTRETKQGGAWMDGFMLHHRDANNNEILPEVIIAGNFPPAIGDTPSLLPLSNISTLFHEMGHALHGLLTQVDEFDVAGTEVAQDVVEFPSQFFEAFWMNPAVLKRLGRHYKTGEVIPDVLIERIIAADRFQKAMFLIRQLEFGLFDMELHLKNGADATQVQQVLNSVRDRFAVVKYPPYNKFQCAFNHIFSWDYSAGYYSYLWAESMAADAYMAFDGNPFNKELSYKYRDTVLAMGGAKEMSEIYIDFMGREPNPESLLQMYGLK